MRIHAGILVVLAVTLNAGGSLHADERGDPPTSKTPPSLKGFTCKLHAMSLEILPFEPLCYALEVTNENDSERGLKSGWADVYVFFRKQGQDEWKQYDPLDCGPYVLVRPSNTVWKPGETRILCGTVVGMKGDYDRDRGQMPPRHVFEEVGAVIELKGCWGPFESDVIQVRVVAPKGADEKACQKLKICDVWRNFYNSDSHRLWDDPDSAKYIAEAKAFAIEFPDSTYAAMANLELGTHQKDLSDEERLERCLKATRCNNDHWRALGHYYAARSAKALGRPADAAGHAEQAGKLAFVKCLEAADRYWDEQRPRPKEEAGD